MRIVYDCKDGCCTFVHPIFGNCDRGMIRGAVFDDELNQWVPVDSICRQCNGDGHTQACLTEDKGKRERNEYPYD